MYKLHYAKLKLKGDIPIYEFKTIDEIIKFIDEQKSPYKKVYLFTVTPCEENEIIVTEHLSAITALIDSGDLANLPLCIYHYNDGTIFHLHEYCSYESGYAVALDMKEGNYLCYDPVEFINED